MSDHESQPASGDSDAAPAARRPVVLIVDDDLELCEVMSEYLREQGCLVHTAHDGRSGLAAALRPGHDVVLLDVMLPVLDGFEVLRQVRRRSRVPIIMLTARAGAQDRVDGLNTGADDYLPKPFHPAELMARISAVLRRAGGSWHAPATTIEVGSVRVNEERRQAWCNGTALPLTSVEFEILDLLVRSAGRIVSRDQIAAVLYQREASPYERSVDVHVSHLRRKLKDLGQDPIRTVRGTGYLFERNP
ncbi:MAG: response regulator transcription factor [Acidobacteria bacterium]|nr:response regulator transcription factor [Acidobacteriota bacterium]